MKRLKKPKSPVKSKYGTLKNSIGLSPDIERRSSFETDSIINSKDWNSFQNDWNNFSPELQQTIKAEYPEGEWGTYKDDARNYAVSEAKSRYFDKINHAMVSYNMAEQAGPAWSKALGTGHELENLWEGVKYAMPTFSTKVGKGIPFVEKSKNRSNPAVTAGDSGTDLRNNSIGINAYKKGLNKQDFIKDVFNKGVYNEHRPSKTVGVFDRTYKDLYHDWTSSPKREPISQYGDGGIVGEPDRSLAYPTAEVAPRDVTARYAPEEWQYSHTVPIQKERVIKEEVPKVPQGALNAYAKASYGGTYDSVTPGTEEYNKVYRADKGKNLLSINEGGELTHMLDEVDVQPENLLGTKVTKATTEFAQTYMQPIVETLAYTHPATAVPLTAYSMYESLMKGDVGGALIDAAFTAGGLKWGKALSEARSAREIGSFRSSYKALPELSKRPSLQTRATSLTDNESFLNKGLVNPKTGTIKRKALTNHLNSKAFKSGNLKEEGTIINEVLQNEFPGNAPVAWEDLRIAVDKRLSRLKHLEAIPGKTLPAGGPRSSTYKEYGITDRGLKYTPDELLFNKTILLENPKKLGTAATKHFNPTTQGHLRTFVTKTEPDVLYVAEAQSDAWQAIKDINKHPDIKIIEGNIAGRRPGEVVNRLTNSLKEYKNRKTGLTEKQGMAKWQTERLFQESFKEAAANNQSTIRIPTSETTAKIQGYQKKSFTDISPQYKKQYDESIKKINGHLIGGGGRSYTLYGEYINLKSHVRRLERLIRDSQTTNVEGALRRIKEFKKRIEGFDKDVMKKQAAIIKEFNAHNDTVDEIIKNHSSKREAYPNNQQRILKRYEEFPKRIKKSLGYEARVVKDAKGNTWYEYDVPEAYKNRIEETVAFAPKNDNVFDALTYKRKPVREVPELKERIERIENYRKEYANLTDSKKKIELDTKIKKLESTLQERKGLYKNLNTDYASPEEFNELIEQHVLKYIKESMHPENIKRAKNIDKISRKAGQPVNTEFYNESLTRNFTSKGKPVKGGFEDPFEALHEVYDIKVAPLGTNGSGRATIRVHVKDGGDLLINKIMEIDPGAPRSALMKTIAHELKHLKTNNKFPPALTEKYESIFETDISVVEKEIAKRFPNASKAEQKEITNTLNHFYSKKNGKLVPDMEEVDALFGTDFKTQLVEMGLIPNKYAPVDKDILNKALTTTRPNRLTYRLPFIKSTPEARKKFIELLNTLTYTLTPAAVAGTVTSKKNK